MVTDCKAELDEHFKTFSLDTLDQFVRLPELAFTYRSAARLWLAEAQCNPFPSDAAFISLGEHQFRSLGQGRGPGVVAVLGLMRATRLLTLSMELTQGKGTRIVSNKTKTPIDGTEGLQQAAADILAYFLSSDGKFIVSLNRRRWKGLRKLHADDPVTLARLAIVFKDLQEPTPTLASIPDGESLWKIWLFLTGRAE